MRTSNKILLIFFLAPAFIMTALFAAIRIKYETGNISPAENIHEERFEKHVLRDVSHVKIIGLQNLAIIPSDTFKLEIEKNSHGRVRYHLNGDTLLIKGDTTFSTSSHSSVHRRSDQYVRLFLPEGKKVFARWTGISLRGSADSVNAPSYSFELASSELQLRRRDRSHNASMTYYGHLSVTADQSSVNLPDGSQVNKLEITLKDQSELVDQGAVIGDIHLVSDDSSVIELYGNNLRKLQLAGMQNDY